jgi:hypothetical protein
LRLVVPSRDRLDAVDATWPVERAATAAHRHWLWGKLMEKKPEQFAVIDADGQTISLWCSAKREVRLEGRRLYRLDYVEVRPRLRGGMAGAFTLALVGARAAEAGCQGLVLAAFPVRTTKTDKRAAAMRWLKSVGPLPTSAMASAESPREQPTATSLRVAQRLAGGLPLMGEGEQRVKRLAAKLDLLKKLAAEQPVREKRNG